MKYTIFIKKNTNENNKIKKFLINRLNKINWTLETKNPDYCFIIAGDGSLFYNLQKYFSINNNVIFVLINDSKIGYYYQYKKTDVKKIINDIIANKLNIIKLPLLEITLLETQQKYYALNEIKLINYISPIKMQVSINDNLFEKMHGTGIVISSSNGSTGFINSLNSAIIMSKTNLLQIKEIAPVINKNQIRLTSSFIVDNDNSINVELFEDNFKIIVDNFEIINKMKNQNKNFIIQYSEKTLSVAGYLTEIKDKIKKIQNIFIENKNE